MQITQVHCAYCHNEYSIRLAIRILSLIKDTLQVISQERLFMWSFDCHSHQVTATLLFLVGGWQSIEGLVTRLLSLQLSLEGMCNMLQQCLFNGDISLNHQNITFIPRITQNPHGSLEKIRNQFHVENPRGFHMG